MQNQDKTVVIRLSNIADELETITGIPAANALRRDHSIIAQLKRIEDALPTAFAITVGSATSARTISFVLQDPENCRTNIARGTQSFAVWLNDTGQTLTINRIFAIADTDDYTFTLYKSDSETDISTSTDTPITTVVCATNGSAMFYSDSATPITVETGKWIIWEHTSGTADILTVIIEGSLA